MRSTFFGLNIAIKGLQTQQRALDVTSHNVANANTPGYTRQDAIMETTLPIKILEGFMGSGVDIAEIRRIRDQYLDIQLRTENKALGEWEAKSNILSKLEVVFNEPSENSLRTVMDEYWESWQQMSKNPESLAVRASVVQSGVTLTETFNHMARQLQDLQIDINQSIGIKVDEINSMARQIRDLNTQIIKAESSGSKANDLRDKRDLLLEQLSKIAAITVNEDSLGAANVTLGGRSLVYRGYTMELSFNDNVANPVDAEFNWIEPISGTIQGAVRIDGGILKGYMDMRDQLVPSLQGKMDEMAERMAQEVNLIHRQGYDIDGHPGEDYFTRINSGLPIGAGNIKVNSDVLNNHNLLAVAAETPALAGDGANALAIAQLKAMKMINPGELSGQTTVTGTALSEPITIDSTNNLLNIAVNGEMKTLVLADGTYTLAALAAHLEEKTNEAYGSPPATATVDVAVDGGNRLQITSLLAGASQGISDLSGSAATLLGIATNYTASVEDYYRSSLAQLGTIALEAQRMTENQALLTDQLINQREMISGVSLDEEMTNMIKFQHAYTASARVINAMDEMLDLIINRLGLVGR